MARPKLHSDFRNRTEFVLEKKEWERFVEVLDRPARVKPEVRRLFSKRSVFSDR